MKQNTGVYDHIGDLYSDYENTAGEVIAQTVPGGQQIQQLMSSFTGWVGGWLQHTWTSDEEDFVKLYMDATGRRFAGEYVEYGHELPEAKVYFSLKYGYPIMNLNDALKALNETWSDGLTDRLKAKQDRNWKQVFTKYGLPAPLPYTFPVGDKRNPEPLKYQEIVDAINAGTFPPKGSAATTHTANNQSSPATPGEKKSIPWLPIAIAGTIIIFSATRKN